jgi:hypothetical protein
MPDSRLSENDQGSAFIFRHIEAGPMYRFNVFYVMAFKAMVPRKTSVGDYGDSEAYYAKQYASLLAIKIPINWTTA